MPGTILHLGASVMCVHAGQAKPTVVSPRVFVSGQAIATMPIPYAITGCSMPPPTAGNGPCMLANWTTAAMRVTSLGQPVLLLDSQAVCVPTGTPLLITLTQTRVIAT